MDFPGQPIGAVEQGQVAGPRQHLHPRAVPGRQQPDQRRLKRRRDQSVIGRQQVQLGLLQLRQLRALIQPLQQRQPRLQLGPGRSTAAPMQLPQQGPGLPGAPGLEAAETLQGGDGIGLVTGAEAGKCSGIHTGPTALRDEAWITAQGYYCRHPLDMAGGQLQRQLAPQGPADIHRLARRHGQDRLQQTRQLPLPACIQARGAAG